MPYVGYAFSGRVYSLNDSYYQVEIYRSDSSVEPRHMFEIGPAGVQLVYESPEDDILVPGIVHSRCEVETIWTTDLADALDDMIDAMVNSEDGVWILQVLRNAELYWCGPIIIDEVQLEETSAARSCRIVASDGISLLKTVDYNNDGVAYNTDQKLFDDTLTQLQEKWVTYDFLNDEAASSDTRLIASDYIYSGDYYLIGSHPPNTHSGLSRRMKLSPHMFTYENEEGDTEFINSYELLDGICKTMLWRLYYYETAWYFVPCYNTDTTPTGNKLNWSGFYAEGNGIQLSSGFNYQIDTLNNEIQKASDWTYTFTPPINEVKITRDTNNGFIVLGEQNLSGGSSLSSDIVQFTTSDAGYVLYGNVLIERSALSPTVGALNDDRLGRYVIELTIIFGDETSNRRYFNTVEAQATGLFSWNLNFTTDGNSIVFAPLSISEGAYGGSGTFSYHDTSYQNCIFDANEDNSSQIFFNVSIPAVEADITGIEISAAVKCYDRDGEYSQTLQDTIDTTTAALYFTYGSGQAQVVEAPSFDIVAESTFGRGSIDLGKTFTGSLHENIGGIMVETAANVFTTSNNWSTVSYDYDDDCNEVGVREVLAAHYKSRRVERGNIVMRGNGEAPAPFALFIDDDTTDVYQCINYRLVSTPAEIEVTLHKVATDGQAQTTTTGKDYSLKPWPRPRPGLGKGQTFGSNIPSGFDFNNDAADAFTQDYSSVFTGETIEGYITHVGPDKGVFFNDQGNTIPDDGNILRKIYTSDDARADDNSTWHEIHTAYRPKDDETLRQAINRIGDYVGSTTNPDRSFIITYQEVVGDKLLNTYSNAQAAYSLRKLDNNYTGNCIQVRNDSGTTLDIGFDSRGKVDTDAILTHVGSGDGTVSIWYDQSGNNRNATQSTVSLQPQIAKGGNINMVNSLPAIDFESNYLDTTAFATNPNGAVNQAVVVQFDTTATRQTAFSQWSSTAANQNFVFQMQEVVVGLRSLYKYTNGNTVLVDDTGNGQANYQYLSVGEFSTVVRARYNGTLVNQTNVSNITGYQPRNNSLALRIGALSHNGAQTLRGLMQELVLWSNSSSHDIADVSDDINSYYDVY